LRVFLAQPRGFCAGVERAIGTVRAALALHGPPVYVRHEIVHNRHVVEGLKALGAVFVDELDEIPDGAPTVFSAHGVAPAVEREAARRGLPVIDATCPLVQKVHRQGRRYAELDYDVVLIGHAGHVEVVGTAGQIAGRVHVVAGPEEVAAIVVRDPVRVAYVTQTTLSVADTQQTIKALQRRFPAIVGPDTRDICYATQNRQQAVQALAARTQAILVVGARNSSNSNRLREIGEAAGVPAYLVEEPGTVQAAWLDGVDRLGLTAGASAPEALVEATVDRLRSFRPVRLETLEGPRETVRFHLPPLLPDEVDAAGRRRAH